MPDPSLQLYGGVPGYVFLWIAAIICVGLFAAGIAYYVRVLAAARPDARWDQIPTRLKLFASNVLLQRRLLREPVIGVAHLLIFWAFVFYAASFFWNLVRGLFPFLPVAYADEVAWMAYAVEALGVLGLVALAAAALRRYAFTPPRLERSRDATLIIALIALVLVSSLVGAGFAAIGLPGAARPAGPAIARGLRAVGFTTPAPGYLAMWWLHMLTVLGFLAYLPYSKHMHLLAAPFGVFFADLKQARLPEPSPGAMKREEFTWRELFSGLACAECGRCDRACPEVAAGGSLSPKELMHDLKLLVRNGGSNGGGLPRPDRAWECAACGSCMETCPAFNEQLSVIIEMRRQLVSQGSVDRELQTALVNLSRYGNSFGQSPRNRSKWTRSAGLSIKDVRKHPAEYLWFTGDHAAFDPRLQAATIATARLFDRAGLDYGLLYEAEQNAGNDVRRIGEEGLFEALRDKNLAAFAKANFRRIVTGDPHSYHALKNEYGRADGVVHTTELLATLLDSGRLQVTAPLNRRVAYQDPCYLARYNGVHEAPRRVLRAIGATVVEMNENRSNTWCCGAGGGRIWMEDTAASGERPADKRVREAAQLHGVRTLVVACPKDFVMFADVVKTAGLEGRLEIQDITQLAEQATRASEGAGRMPEAGTRPVPPASRGQAA